MSGKCSSWGNTRLKEAAHQGNSNVSHQDNVSTDMLTPGYMKEQTDAIRPEVSSMRQEDLTEHRSTWHECQSSEESLLCCKHKSVVGWGPKKTKKKKPIQLLLWNLFWSRFLKRTIYPTSLRLPPQKALWRAMIAPCTTATGTDL